MSVGIFFVLTILLCFILTRDVTFVFIKEDDIKIYLRIFNKNINLIKKKKSSHRLEKTKGKKQIPYLKLIKTITKLLKSSKVFIKSIVIPIKNEFDSDSFLSSYKALAIVYSLVAFISSQIENTSLGDNFVSFSSVKNSICFDITIESGLFHVLLAVSVLFFHYFRMPKNRKRKRVCRITE